jgi:hypothetical protein
MLPLQLRAGQRVTRRSNALFTPTIFRNGIRSLFKNISKKCQNAFDELASHGRSKRRAGKGANGSAQSAAR